MQPWIKNRDHAQQKPNVSNRQMVAPKIACDVWLCSGMVNTERREQESAKHYAISHLQKLKPHKLVTYSRFLVAWQRKFFRKPTSNESFELPFHIHGCYLSFVTGLPRSPTASRVVPGIPVAAKTINPGIRTTVSVHVALRANSMKTDSLPLGFWKANL
jgi:hypothetical protein